MNHVDLDDLADLVLEPAATPDSVRAHVESCAECRDRLDALLDVRRLAVGEPLVAPPDRVRAQVLAQVRGADVTAVEPLPEGSRLWSHERVLLSPHTAALHEDEPARIVALFADNARRLLDGEPMRNVVDTVEFY